MYYECMYSNIYKVHVHVALPVWVVPMQHLTKCQLTIGDPFNGSNQYARLRKYSTSTASKLAIPKCTTFRYNAMIARRGASIRVLYGRYPNKHNLSRSASEASVTYDIL